MSVDRAVDHPEMTTWKLADGGLIVDEYSFVTSDDWFDDIDEPVELTKEVWVCQSSEFVKIYPSTWETDHAWVGIEGHPDDDECSVCGAGEYHHAESTR